MVFIALWSSAEHANILLMIIYCHHPITCMEVIIRLRVSMHNHIIAYVCWPAYQTKCSIYCIVGLALLLLITLILCGIITIILTTIIIGNGFCVLAGQFKMNSRKWFFIRIILLGTALVMGYYFRRHVIYYGCFLYAVESTVISDILHTC